MPQIRVLQPVAGASFSWHRGQIVDVDAATAKAWADGIRAELVTDTSSTQARAEKATPRSRGGGRGRRAETRKE